MGGSNRVGEPGDKRVKMGVGIASLQNEVMGDGGLDKLWKYHRSKEGKGVAPTLTIPITLTLTKTQAKTKTLTLPQLPPRSPNNMLKTR